MDTEQRQAIEEIKQERYLLREKIDLINHDCELANRLFPVEGWGPLLKPAGRVGLLAGAYRQTKDANAKLTQERDALVEAIQDAIGAGSAEAIIEDLKEALANIEKGESKCQIKD
jgi:hypothetical protein